MQVDPGATIDALSSAISALLAPSNDPAFSPQVAILPAHTNLAGIGGFIGHSKASPAERVARRLEGEVVVRVFAGTAAALLDAEARVARDLLAARPDLLRQHGILKLQRVLDARDSRLESADGPPRFGQELRFAVKFEHAPLPTESEGAITSVPQDMTVARVTRRGRLLYETDFRDDRTGDFTPLAGTDLGTPQWRYEDSAVPEDREVRQTSALGGGDAGMSGDKTGAYLVLRDAVAGGALDNFVFHAEMRSDGPGGIGMVFRYQDRGNFGFFLMEGPPGRRLFGRRQNGVGALLTEGGQDPTQGFPIGTWLRLRLLAEDDRFELAINEVVALAGRDANLGKPGSVGLFCRGNPTARFRHVRLTGL